MNNNFDILKNIDNDELYEKTYITHNNLDDIKNKNFEAFSRFKLNGFIDILSKRLELDLSDFRDEANRYFDEIEPKDIVESEIVESDNLTIDRKLAILIGVGVVVLAILIAIVMAYNSQKSDEDFAPIEPQPIEQQMAPIIPTEELVVNENNISDVNNTSEQVVSKETVTQNVVQDMKIIPQKNIWVGIIDVATKEKKEYSGKNEIILDKTKHQIIVVDGAYISLMDGDKETSYAQDGRIRFMIEDGKIKEIRFAQFKELNNGKAW